jgi:hypothetical protein
LILVGRAQWAKSTRKKLLVTLAHYAINQVVLRALTGSRWKQGVLLPKVVGYHCTLHHKPGGAKSIDRQPVETGSATTKSCCWLPLYTTFFLLRLGVPQATPSCGF